MNRYKTVNNLVGWITFAIAAFVYCSTIEPSASYWDCPEFITTGYKLEIGHPPGAPFFMLTANLFSQFAQDPSHVAMMVNVMSALMSAACILFLFWSITHLARKLIVRDGENPTTAQLIEVIGAGVVGALAYTFSDTFWFSAVEGEVYAYDPAGGFNAPACEFFARKLSPTLIYRDLMSNLRYYRVDDCEIFDRLAEQMVIVPQNIPNLHAMFHSPIIYHPNIED